MAQFNREIFERNRTYNYVTRPPEAFDAGQQVEPPGFLRSIWDNVWGGAESMVGGALDTVGTNFKSLYQKGEADRSTGELGKWIVDRAIDLNDLAAKNAARSGVLPEYNNQNLWERLTNTNYYTDPRGLTADASNMVGSMIPFVAATAAMDGTNLPAMASGFLSGGIERALGRIGLKNAAKLFSAGTESEAAGAGAEFLRDAATWAGTAGLDAASNVGEIGEEMRKRGASDKEIAEAMNSAMAYELPTDFVTQGLFGGLIGGKGMRALTRDKSFPKKVVANTGAVVTNAGNEGFQEFRQTQAVEQALGQPVGTFMNPTPQEASAFASAFVGTVPMGIASGARNMYGSWADEGDAVTEDAPAANNAPTLTSGNAEIDDAIVSAAAKHGLPADLLFAVAQAESDFDQSSVSSTGAKGIMQLMPDTAAALGVDADDMVQNIEGGARYLKQQLDDFGGNVEMALAAYNAGPGAVEKYKGVPPYTETQNYVAKIMGILDGANMNPAMETEAVPDIQGYDMPTQSDRITEQVAHLKPAWQEQLPMIGGILKYKFGLDAVISSGARTPEHNAEVGGAQHSHHIDHGDGGDAVDIVLPEGTSSEQAEAVRQFFEESGAFAEVLFHDAGSGYHLHLGGLKGSLRSFMGGSRGTADVNISSVSGSVRPIDYSGLVVDAKNLQANEAAMKALIDGDKLTPAQKAAIIDAAEIIRDTPTEASTASPGEDALDYNAWQRLIDHKDIKGIFAKDPERVTRMVMRGEETQRKAQTAAAIENQQKVAQAQAIQAQVQAAAQAQPVANPAESAARLASVQQELSMPPMAQQEIVARLASYAQTTPNDVERVVIQNGLAHGDFTGIARALPEVYRAAAGRWMQQPQEQAQPQPQPQPPQPTAMPAQQDMQVPNVQANDVAVPPSQEMTAQMPQQMQGQMQAVPTKEDLADIRQKLSALDAMMQGNPAYVEARRRGDWQTAAQEAAKAGHHDFARFYQMLHEKATGAPINITPYQNPAEKAAAEQGAVRPTPAPVPINHVDSMRPVDIPKSYSARRDFGRGIIKAMRMRNLPDVRALNDDLRKGEKRAIEHALKRIAQVDAEDALLRGETAAQRANDNETVQAESRKKQDDDVRAESAPKEGKEKAADEGGATVEENIARGMEAMKKVIETHEDVRRAMHRDDTGAIDFVWGFAGKGEKLKQGYGVAHILAKHVPESGENLPYKIVETIAKGKIVQKKTTGGSTQPRLVLEHDGYVALFSIGGNNSAWLLSGWEKYDSIQKRASIANGEGDGSTAATATAPMRSRRDGEDTLSSASNIPSEQEKSKEKSVQEKSAPIPADFSASKLKGAIGKTASIATDSGEEIPVRYRLVEAKSLITSNSAKDFSKNPAYPKSLQPRDRERANMQQQIREMASRLRPEDLAASRSVNLGAPVVRADGVVLNGNGRAIAITRALLGNTFKDSTGKGYRAFLVEHAEEFGFKPETARKMHAPMLVREVTGGLNAEQVKAVTTSTTGGSRLGASEQAKQDAEKITLEDLARYEENERGDLTTAANRDFVAGILYRVAGKNDVNAYTDAKGQVNADGIQRVKRALFQKAYGDDDLLSRMSESTNDDTRNITNGLTIAAPYIARANEKMARGTAHSYKLGETIADAVKRYNHLHDIGQSVENYLDQQAMFAEYEDSPEVREVLRVLNENRRSGKRIAQFVRRIGEIAETQGNPNEISLMEGGEPLPFGDIIEIARKKFAEEEASRTALVHEAETLYQQATERFPGIQDKEVASHVREAIQTTLDFGSLDGEIRAVAGQIYQDANGTTFSLFGNGGKTRSAVRNSSAREIQRQEIKAQKRGKIYGLGITRALVNDGAVSLVGQKAKSPAALAEIAQVLRHPGYEKFHTVYTKANGAVVYHETVSARLPHRSVINAPEDKKGAVTSKDVLQNMYKRIEENLRKTGADKFYYIHNHPSGNPHPSAADIQITRRILHIKNRTNEMAFAGHIVLDHNKYAVIDESLRVGEFELKNKTPITFEAPEKNHPVLGETILGPNDTSRIAEMCVADAETVAFHLTPRLVVRGVQKIHDDFKKKSWGKQMRYLRHCARITGGTYIVLATSNRMLFEFGKADINNGRESGILDIVFMQDRRAIETGNNVGESVMNRQNWFGLDMDDVESQRLLEPTRQYGVSLDTLFQEAPALKKAALEYGATEKDGKVTFENPEREKEFVRIAKALQGDVAKKLSAAWTGSSADFDNFDMAYVGTGVGAQAHGYGLHMAEERQTAEGYRTERGKLYHVEIPDNDVLLDEQKSFDEQPLKVRKALEKVVRSFTLEQLENWNDVRRLGKARVIAEIMDALSESNGMNIYGTISDLVEGQKEASILLNQYGIKGITYHEAQSGRCYVIFDDKAIKILEKFSARRQEVLSKVFKEVEIVAPEKLTKRQQGIADFGKEMGMPVVFFRGAKNLHGFHAGNGVTFLNVNSETSLPWTFWHETLHWMKTNNENLFRSIIEDVERAGAFTKAQLDGYRKEIGAFDLSDAEVIEEMLADALPDVKRRVPFMKDLGKRNKSLAERFVGWIRDVMDKFRDHFAKPGVGLTKAQSTAMRNAFAALARDMVDERGRRIFHVDEFSRRITLANGSPLPSAKYSLDNREGQGDNKGKERKLTNRITIREDGGISITLKYPPKPHESQKVRIMRRKAEVRDIDAGLVAKGDRSAYVNLLSDRSRTVIDGRIARGESREDIAKEYLLKYNEILANYSKGTPEEKVIGALVNLKGAIYYATDAGNLKGRDGRDDGTVAREQVADGQRVDEAAVQERAGTENGNRIKDKHPETGAFSMVKFSRDNSKPGSTGRFRRLLVGLKIGEAAESNLEVHRSNKEKQLVMSAEKLNKFMADKALTEKNILKTEDMGGGKIRLTYMPQDFHNIHILDWLKSVRQLRKKNPFVKAIYDLGSRAMRLQEHLRNEGAKMVKEFNNLTKNKDDRKLVTSILLEGDAAGKEYGVQELRAMGANANVIKAYQLVRRTIREWYKRVNDARMRVETRKKTLSKNDLADFKKNHWIQDSDVLSVEEKGGGKILLTWRGIKTYETENRTMTKEELDALLQDKDVNVTHFHKLNDSYGVDNYSVDYVERIKPLGNLTGYIPHFFHEWIVYEKHKDPKTGEVRLTTIGSGRSMNDAVRLGNEIARKNSDKEYVVQPKIFDLNVENSVVIGDVDFQQMAAKLAENTTMTLSDANAFLRNNAGATMRARHRFFGNAMHRTGAKGFDTDITYVLTHYLNTSARYIAMEQFKSRAITLYERWFGAFDTDPKDATASYVKGLIKDINGDPRQGEKYASQLIMATPFGKMISDAYGDRTALALNAEVSTWNAISKLGLGNFASMAVNFSQFINIGAAMNDYGYAAKGFRSALHPTAADVKILEESGVLDEINQAADNGGYTQRRFGRVGNVYGVIKRVGELSLLPFQYADVLMRKTAILGAYKQGVEQLGLTHEKAMERAREINYDANFDYSSANAPLMIRWGSVWTQQLFQFQKYPIMQMEFMYNILKDGTMGQKVRFFLPYVLLCGIPGMIPFGEIFNQIFSFLFRYASGNDKDIGNEIKAEALRWAGKDPTKKAIVNAAIYGVLAPTFGIDVSKRIGISGAFSGEFFGAQKPESVGGMLAMQLGGPAVSTAVNIQHQLHNGNPIEALKAFSPALGNMAQAMVGVSRTTRHRVKSRYETTYDRIIHAMGFRSVDESNNSFITSYEFDRKDAETHAKQEAIMDYLDDPSEANRQRINALGIKDKAIEEARIQQERSATERAKGGRPKVESGKTSKRRTSHKRKEEKPKKETLFDTIDENDEGM